MQLSRCSAGALLDSADAEFLARQIGQSTRAFFQGLILG